MTETLIPRKCKVIQGAFIEYHLGEGSLALERKLDKEPPNLRVVALRMGYKTSKSEALAMLWPFGLTSQDRVSEVNSRTCRSERAPFRNRCTGDGSRVLPST